ncbi:UDP-N-acetylmuramate dehydrogenase [Streptomyces sp. NPDC020742]|uniref:UDP-N-acetylmuramate dehydrogenase n=1 Tax=Streptomyces sp. NPDC020742 TaxID=3154897 RepID=UPI0033FBC1CF
MRIAHDIPLGPLTTLGIGGPAAWLLELDEPADFTDAVSLLEQRTPSASRAVADGRRTGHTDAGTPVTLGHGSNVLAGDRGCTAPVLRMATRGVRLLGADERGRRLVEVQAGHPLSDLVNTALTEGLMGTEMLAGIPGTVGAAPVQNVGAYGQEISDVLVDVTAWDWQLRRRVRIPAEECGLGHRTSVFKGARRWTLLTLVLALRPATLSAPVIYPAVAGQLDVPVGSRVPLAEAAQAVRDVRRGKGMVLDELSREPRTIGSVFLSPEVTEAQATALRRDRAPVHSFPDGSIRVSASWLIRRAGFALGTTVADGVRISSQHYTLVADDGATSAGFIEATTLVRQRVLERTGVLLTPEIDCIGDGLTDGRGMAAAP